MEKLRAVAKWLLDHSDPRDAILVMIIILAVFGMMTHSKEACAAEPLLIGQDQVAFHKVRKTVFNQMDAYCRLEANDADKALKFGAKIYVEGGIKLTPREAVLMRYLNCMNVAYGKMAAQTAKDIVISKRGTK